MREKQVDLDELNIQIKVVTFDADLMALAYINETKIDWPFLLDEDKELYKAYDFSEGSWWSIYKPGSIWKYLKLILSGDRPGRPGKDWRQLGGDVLIDPTGMVRLHHVSTDPHDRPSADSILELVKQHHDRLKS